MYRIALPFVRKGFFLRSECRNRQVAGAIRCQWPLPSGVRAFRTPAACDPRRNSMIRSRPYRPHLDRLEDRALMDVGFRSIDGSGNNLANPDWGSTDVQLLRRAPSAYGGNGLNDPAGADRLSPREISNGIVAHDPEEIRSDRQMSAWIYVWGQFLDHDLDLTQP